MHGQFVWYELTTPDVDAAQKFYPRFTGWGTQRYDNDYTMWTTAGAPFAGIFRLSPEQRAQGVPPNWMPYVETSNVDETATQATSLGGRVVHGPQDIPGTGRFAVVQDPQGAVFGIYKSTAPSQGWDGTPVLGRFSWHELMTTDYTKAYEFYRKLFGWEKTGEMDMGGGSMYLMYGKGKMYGGMFNRPPAMAAMPPFWLCYILVKDVSKAVAAAVKGGATVQRPPMEIPGGVIAILGDPQGAAFALHHVTAAAAAPKPAPKEPARATSRAKAKAKAKKTKGKAKAKAGTKVRAKAKGRAVARKKSPSKKSRTAGTSRTRRHK
jgi:predicted enzyme related to lactoylglutathione lyase